MKLKLHRASTSKFIRLFIQDSTKTDGSGLAGLTSGSSGLICYYIREGDGSTQSVLLQAGTIGTYTSNGQLTSSTYGFIEVDSVHMKGVYELSLPNASLSSGNSSLVMLSGATNMVPVLAEIELDTVNYQDGTAFGLTALPSVAAGATNGLPLSANSSGQVQVDLTQAIPTSNTAQTHGDALNAARAQGFGKWVLSGTTLTLYANDGTTTVRTFTLDSSTSPTQRI